MIYLCMPTYGGVHPEAWRAFQDAESRRLPIHTKTTLHSSILGECFNILWTNALNLQLDGVPITRWVMSHGDVAPEPGWLDTLLEKMDECQVDVLSAVVPVKDGRGLTSTAYDGDDRWNPARVMTLAETLESPNHTWFHRDLLVNTGCVCVDFTKGWRKLVSFGIDTEICPAAEDGRIRYRCRTMTEDWRFSRMVRARGGKLAATNCVRLKHYDHSGKGWPNYAE